MRKTSLALAVAAFPGLSLLASAPAHADQPAASANRTFATMDRVGADSSAGVDLSVLDFDDDSFFAQVSVVRFDLHGRYVHESGAGIAVDLPISQGSDGVESVTELGSITVDGLYALRSGDGQLFLRAGLVLPTGHREDEILHGLAGYGRITDLPTALGDTTMLRLSASPQLERGSVFVRADLGIDVAVTHPADPPDQERNRGPYAHANLGIGTSTGPFQLSAELANAIRFGDNGSSDGILDTAAVAAQFTELPVQPHVAVVVPLDDDMRSAMDFAVILGVDGALPL